MGALHVYVRSEAEHLPLIQPDSMPPMFSSLLNLFSVTSSIAELMPSCPPGWTSYSIRCFLYVPSTMTWANAEKYCQSQGGNLASVHSFDEQHVIQTMIQRQTSGYPLAWLGGCDAAQEGTWFWSDGTPFSYNYWATGQPDNRANANCLLMNFGDEKKFDDQPCNYIKPFVCAKKL
ncbi:galactose-specific lectin nattectin-like isoform X1 [Sparus aurata]|uniref:galactose-specific lectin nattectin-like isoform X1 n=1 Tax=Sparus aurata TaxID=8175 RepID=UPI0011C1C4E2|nr:galactose-specific lectin nattectin-like isoform X1 [Sparus aurata]